MSLTLINLQSNQQIKIDHQNPLIIGRRNVEGCFDKRVSRNHGRITYTDDGKIRLEALHCNPLFFTRNGVPPVLQINKNEEETLKEGDCLGLLPNAFWFQITSDKDVKIKKEPEELSTAETNLNDSAIPENRLQEIKEFNNESCSNTTCESKDKLKEKTILNSPSTSNGFGSPEFEKTRRLPIWMYEIDEPVVNNTNSTKRPTTNSSEFQEKKPKLATEVKAEPNSSVETGNDDEIVMINEPSTSKTENDSQAAGLDHEESNKHGGHKDDYEEDVNESQNSKRRPICQYEEKCYRKNPNHKSDFSHPGDDDYIPYEARPVCPYGADCYRRNKTHRTEFKHPNSENSSLANSPSPTRRTRKKVKKQKIDYEDEEDEYESENPFADDASSDDYVPTDWESEEEERA